MCIYIYIYAYIYIYIYIYICIVWRALKSAGLFSFVFSRRTRRRSAGFTFGGGADYRFIIDINVCIISIITISSVYYY